MRSYHLASVIAFVAVFESGCGVSVDRVTVESGANPTRFPNPGATPPSIWSTLKRILQKGPRRLFTGSPTTSVARASGNFVTLGSMSRVNSTSTYRLEGVAIPDGPVSIRVQTEYGVIFQSGNRTASKSVKYAIALPDGCFFFDPDVAGWTASPNFIGSLPTGEGVAICEGQTPVVGADGPNIPRNLTGHGPLFSLRDRRSLAPVACVFLRLHQPIPVLLILLLTFNPQT